jgi:pyruvate kinase
MLESMAQSRLPTRAEATDVANAILDGTDCVMLSAESAVGRYPEDAVRMLARIAEATEAGRGREPKRHGRRPGRASNVSEAAAALVDDALLTVPAAVLMVPTNTGATARMIASRKPPVWTIALCPDHAVCQGLLFSYGVFPSLLDGEPDDWRAFTAEWMRDHGLSGSHAMLVAGPSAAHPEKNHRIEFMRLDDAPGPVA